MGFAGLESRRDRAMEITWLGHSCFRLRSEETVVIVDPFPDSLGLKLDNRQANVVTVSNTHPNHSNWQEVAGDPKVFMAPGEYEYSGISVRGVMTPLSEGTPREQRNVAYTIGLDNVNICHLGDITEPLTPRLVDELGPVDVLLVPVGGGCTLEVEQVLQIMQDLDAKIVIPMHYSIPNITVSLATLDAFLQLQGSSEVQPQPRMSVTISNLPPTIRVSVLAPQSRSV